MSTSPDTVRRDGTSRTFRLPPRGRELAGDAPFSIVACSRCLRVQRGSKWIEPEVVIRELRSFELPAPPRLEPGICDRCAEIIDARRTKTKAA